MCACVCKRCNGIGFVFFLVQEEKRRMKEEIERRRAEAAERRQKVEEEVDGEASKPFKCVSPRGSSLKVSSHSFSPSLPCFFFFFLFFFPSVLTDSQEHTDSTNAHSAVSII